MNDFGNLFPSHLRGNIRADAHTHIHAYIHKYHHRYPTAEATAVYTYPAANSTRRCECKRENNPTIATQREEGKKAEAYSAALIREGKTTRIGDQRLERSRAFDVGTLDSEAA